MSPDRAPYVKPEVLTLEYEVDPRVTLASSCKFTGDSRAAGPNCRNATNVQCNNISAS